MRKLCLILLLCLVPCAVRAAGQEAADPPAGVLVQCGAEQVATFEGTASKDGQYAVGWTIRAKGGKKAPAPWVESNQDDPKIEAATRLLENEDGTPRHSDYTVVNGLVDLKAKRFTPWPSQEPHFAGQARADVEAAWSEDDQGVHYGILFNNHEGNSSQVTIDLQLVVVSSDGVHLTDLKPAADAAIKAYLRKRDPKDAARYAWMCTSDVVNEESRPAVALFKGETLSLPFTAAISQEQQNVDAGRVSFALPQGTVTSTDSDPAARKALLR